MKAKKIIRATLGLKIGQGYFFNEATTYGMNVVNERKLFGRINPGPPAYGRGRERNVAGA